MANRLLLRDRKQNIWGKVEARVFWDGGGQDGVWVNELGIGEFTGTGVVKYIKVAGEEIVIAQRVNGETTIVAVSKSSH